MKKKIIGYTTGIYDMFNIDHLNILEKAKLSCDYLIVGVSTDEFVQKETDKAPVIPYVERAEIVNSIRYVDQVIPVNNEIKRDDWENLNFDKVFVSSECKGTLQWKKNEDLFNPLGVEILYIQHVEEIASNQLSSFVNNELKEINSIQFNNDKTDTIGYTTGVFDLFHIGHLNILRRAKERCDKLIVGVSTDENVMSYKHKKPTVPFNERIRIIKAIKYVDYVAEQADMDKFKAWEKLHYDVMFHGSDWKNSSMYNEVEAKLNTVGVKVVFLPHTEGVSTTMLSEKIKK